MRCALVLGVLIILSLGGCGCSDDPGVDPLSRGELDQIPALTPVKLKELLEAQKGKIAVLAIWSIRREDSVAMYPRLNELATGGAEPVVIAVNIDRVADIRDKVLPIVKREKPKFLNHVLSVGPEALTTFIDPNWPGQLPALALYDRAGKRSAAFFGPDALDKTKAALAKLLKKGKR